MQKFRLNSFTQLRPAVIVSRSFIAAAALLAASLVQPASAQTIQAFQQSVMQLKTLGQSTIHGGPVSSGAKALVEIRPGDASVAPKNQTAGIAAAPGAGARH